jgi:hypothetical protein
LQLRAKSETRGGAGAEASRAKDPRLRAPSLFRLTGQADDFAAAQKLTPFSSHINEI